jgi:hypothetical protein
MKLRTLSALLSLFLCAACADEDAPCATDDDCFSGEVCRADNTCGDPNSGGGMDAGYDDATPYDAATATDLGQDLSNDTSRATDVGQDAGTDAAVDQGNGGVCIVDPFTATCDRPDENDTFPEYVDFDPRPPGCQDGADELETNEVTLTNLQLCANETADLYTTNLVTCDTKSFFVEAYVVPTQACDPALYSLDISVQGNSCDEPNGMVQCTTLADGGKKVVARVEPSRQVISARVTLEPTEDDVQFDYDLRVVVRE